MILLHEQVCLSCSDKLYSGGSSGFLLHCHGLLVPRKSSSQPIILQMVFSPTELSPAFFHYPSLLGLEGTFDLSG